jgi:hypothetical protein
MSFEKATPLLRQRYRWLAVAGHTDRFDEAVLAQVAKVARAWVRRPIAVVAEITTGDNSKCPNCS